LDFNPETFRKLHDLREVFPFWAKTSPRGEGYRGLPPARRLFTIARSNPEATHVSKITGARNGLE
jgi:hypothetical protein